MRIRDVVVMSFLFAGMGLLRPGSALAVYACIDGDPCRNSVTVDAPIGCLSSTQDTYCYTNYGQGTANCDAECRYGVITYAFPYSFKECAPDAAPPYCNSTVTSSIGPGTCCENQSGGNGCTTTAPSGLVIDRDYPGAKINMTWNPGSGGIGVSY